MASVAYTQGVWQAASATHGQIWPDHGYTLSMPEITMYTSDRCPYCIRAKRLLDQKGATYSEIHIALNDYEARRRISEITGQLTVPQILIDGEPIGGWYELSALERAGKLDPLLAA